MFCTTKDQRRCFRIGVTSIILGFSIATVSGRGGVSPNSIQERQPSASHQRAAGQSKESVRDETKEGLKDERSSLKKKSPDQIEEEKLAAIQRKKQLESYLLESVLAGAHRITPVEYGLLVQVEAATLLWDTDRDRAQAALKKAWDGMREMLEAKRSDDEQPTRKQQKLRFAVLRRIARLDPRLLNQLAADSATGESKPAPVLGKWTDEARAIVSVAQEQVDTNPALAAQLAQRSLPFGLVDWVPFLDKLSQRDSALAEQVASNVIVQFGNGPVSPVELLRLDRFVLSPNRSPQLRELYFRVLASRCLQGLNPNAPTEALQSGSRTAQRALAMATGPVWPAKFQEIVGQYETLLSARYAALTTVPEAKAVDMSAMLPSKAGDTSEIEEASQRVQRIRDPKARDKEYQTLAASAANNENLSLAEELMSKIDNDDIRRETTLRVYGPLVRKDLSEGDWTKAQTDALKITYPIGRTLVLDIVAQMILRSGKAKKEDANQVYDTAMSKLEHDGATEDVAKGFLVLAKSLLAVDSERCLQATNSAIFVLNKVTKGTDWLADSETSGALASWVSLPIPTVRYDEVLDFPEMIGPLFKELAKRDLNNAESTAYSIAHSGLSSLAQLGIVSEVQKELRVSTRTAEPTNKSKSPVRQ